MKFYYFARIRTASCNYTADGYFTSDRDFVENISRVLGESWTASIQKEEYFPPEDQLKALK